MLYILRRSEFDAHFQLVERHESFVREGDPENVFSRWAHEHMQEEREEDATITVVVDTGDLIQAVWEMDNDSGTIIYELTIVSEVL